MNNNRNNNVKPGKNLKMAAGLVASAAAATVAAMAYKVNEDKINAGVDKVAAGTKTIIDKASKKVKEVADDIMAMVEEETAAESEDAAEAEEVAEAENAAEDVAECRETAEESSSNDEDVMDVEVVEAEIVEDEKSK